MNKDNVLLILSSLSSTKQRERKQALDDLSTILKEQPEILPKNLLQSLSETLIEQIDLEYRKYSRLIDSDETRSKINLSEDKLSDLSYVLRLLIEKSNNRIRLKTVNFLLVALPACMLSADCANIVRPVANHLSFATLSLVSTEIFKNKFNEVNWIDLMEQMLKIFDLQIKSNISDKTTMNIISIIQLLLQFDTVAFNEITRAVLSTFIRFVECNKIEYAHTRLLLSSINDIIVKMHLFNIKDVLCLCNSTCRYVLLIGTSNNEGAQLELAKFDYFFSDLIDHKLPDMIGDEYIDAYKSIKKESFCSLLSEYLILKINYYKPFLLSSSYFQFDCRRAETRDFFTLGKCQFNEDGKDLNWLNLLSLTKLLIAYFAISLKSEDNLLSFKKQKNNNDFESILRSSDTLISFILNCLSNTNQAATQLLGLQVLFTYSLLTSIDTKNFDIILQTLYKFLDNDQLKEWCMLSFISLVSQNNLIPTQEIIINVLRFCLPLVKYANSCKLTCSLITEVIRNSDFLVDDLKVKNEIHDILEYPELHGPAISCNEAYLFWQYLYHYGIMTELSSNIPSIKSVMKWLIVKYQEIDDFEASSNRFSTFVAWLCGQNVNNYYNTNERTSNDYCYVGISDSKLNSIYSEWNKFEKSRKFLLQVDNYAKKDIPEKLYSHVPVVQLDSIESNSFLSLLLDKVDNEKTTSSKKKLDGIFELIMVTDKLAGNSFFVEFSMRCRDFIRVSISNLSFESEISFTDILRKTALLQVYDTKSTMPDLVSADLLLNSLENELEKCQMTADGNLSGSRIFETISEQKDSVNKRREILIRLSIEAILKIYTGSHASNGLLSLVKLLEVCDSETLICCFPSILCWINSNNFCSDKQIKNLEVFTQLLGEKFLTPNLNSSNTTISFLILYLNAVRSQWINFIGSPLYEDCIDILEWIISGFESSSYSGENTIVKLSVLLLNLLHSHQLSNETIKGGRQRIFSLLISCLTRLSPHYRLLFTDSIKQYMKTLGFKNQLIFFTEVQNIYQVPQQSIELTSLYSLFLFRIQESSYLVLINALSRLLEFSKYQHTRIYVESVVKKITKSLNFSSPIDLFESCKYDLLTDWCEKMTLPESTLEGWDEELFGFSSKQEFFERYLLELYSFKVSFSLESKEFSKMISAGYTRDEKVLLMKSSIFCIPFSYSENGAGDDIFDLYQKILGSDTKFYLRDYRIIISRNMLRFIDLSSIIDIAAAFQTKQSSFKFISKLLKCKNASKQYQNVLRIDVNVGIKVINEHCITAEDSLSNFSFLIFWILKDLTSAAFTVEKVHLVREIKLLLTIYEHKLSDFSALNHIIFYLAPFVQDLDLHHEVAPLFVTLIQSFSIEHVLPKANLSCIFLNLLIFKNLRQGDIDASLLKLLKYLENFDIPEISFWKMCTTVLADLPVSCEIYQVLSLLDFSSFDINFLSLISLVLDHAPALDHKPSFTETQLLNLMPIINFDILQECKTVNYEIWISYIAKCVFTMESHGAQFKSRFSSIVEKYEIWTNVKDPVRSLFTTFVKYAKEFNVHKTSAEVFLSQCLASYIYSSMSTTSLLKRLADDDIRFLETHATILSKDSFKFISNFSSSHDLVTFSQRVNASDLSSMFNANVTYEKWLVALIEVFMKLLMTDFEDIDIFLPLCDSSQYFSEQILFDLFPAAMVQNSADVGNLFINLTDNISTLLETKCGKQKVKVVSDILLFLRIGSRKGEVLSAKMYNRINNFQDICRYSLKCEQTYLAYMLFEEITMMKQSSVDYNFLRNIYYEIKDYDLLSGLPSARSFLDAYDSINLLSNDIQKQYLFNNAKFDSTDKLKNGNDIFTLAKSTAASGFYSLATILDKNSASVEHSYEWKLQLGEWNLPSSGKLDTKSKCLYKTIKDVQFSGPNIMGTLHASLISIFGNKNNFESFSDWLSTISEVNNYLDIISFIENPDANIIDLFNTQHDADKRILQDVDFGSYKLNLDSRSRFVDVISKNANLSSKYDESFLKLILFTQSSLDLEFVLANNCTQDALRNSFMLESVLHSTPKVLQEDNLFDIMKRKSSYLNARTLWMVGEESTAVNMLNDILGNQKTLRKSSGSKWVNFMNYFSVSDDEIKSTLIKWLSTSKLESSFDIYEKYIANYSVTTDNYEILAEVFNVMANFLNEQVEKLQNNGEITEREKRCYIGSTEMETLLNVYNSGNLSSIDKKELKRQYRRTELQLASDKEVLNELIKQKNQFISKALDFYLQVLIFTNSYDDDVIDKFCNLWFEFDEHIEVNEMLQKKLKTVPSWKFLPWVNQMVSKLSNDNSDFQKCLQAIITNVVYKLPYDSIYSLMGILYYKRYPINSDESISQKVIVVESILTKLSSTDKGQFYINYIKPVQNFCDHCFELANVRFNSNVKEINLKNQKFGKYWLTLLLNDKLPSPTAYTNITCSNDGRLPRPYITKIQDTVNVTSTGLSLPKVLTFYLSDGSKNKMLLKGGNDDLRQDAIMEQVFMQVNKILQNNKELRNHELRIKTYKVIPLGPKTGIIEFVANSVSLHNILVKLHSNDSIRFDQARRLMKQVQNKSKEERLKIFLDLTERIKPQFRNFFFDSFVEPSSWFNAKKTYVKGVATTSIVGHILGLGDRHLNNILIDCYTGEPIHIDLGIAFDQGKLLPIPELVPFRLTNDIVDAFGVTGVDGMFRKNCERVYSVLRENHDQVMCVLNILKWDPLYSWVMSPIRKHRNLIEEDTTSFTIDDAETMKDKVGMSKRRVNGGGFSSSGGSSGGLKLSEDNENIESYRALKGVEEKLLGDGLSVQATVQELIQQASDPQNLAVIFLGWTPFY